MQAAVDCRQLKLAVVTHISLEDTGSDFPDLHRNLALTLLPHTLAKSGYSYGLAAMFGEVGSNLRNYNRYRASASAPRFAMEAADLDGYLTALALSQQKLAEREWIQAIFSTPSPEFDDSQQAKAVFADIHELAALHVTCTSEKDWLPRPKLVRLMDGSLDAAEWCQGFMQLVAEDRSKWSAAFRDASLSMMAISHKCLDVDGNNLSGTRFNPGCTTLFGYQYSAFIRHLQAIHAVMLEGTAVGDQTPIEVDMDRNGAAHRWSISQTLFRRAGSPDQDAEHATS